MIILIDNENYMIRLCKDDPNIHGFHPSYPNWKAIVRFLSDIGEMVVLSGDEQEQWLDENAIYYVHVEKKPKENFENFKKRMYRQIEENKEYVETSTSYGKRVYSVEVRGRTTIEVWRMNDDNKYHIVLDIKDNDNDTMADDVLAVSSEFFKDVLKEKLEASAVWFYVTELLENHSTVYDLLTANSLTEVYYNLLGISSLVRFGLYDVE